MMKVDVETNSKAVYAVKTMEEGKQDATFSQKERQFLALIMANRHQNIVRGSVHSLKTILYTNHLPPPSLHA